MFRKNSNLNYIFILLPLSLAMLVFAACAPAAQPPAAAQPTAIAQATVAPAEPTAAPAQATAAPAEPTAATATEYKAEIRPATKRWKIGYGDGLAGIPFTDSVTKSINDVAAKMGVDIVYCDNAYNQEKTVECSNSLVTQQADGVIFANWIAGTEELVAGIFHAANIPCVTYDGPHPGCVAFGPDNFEAGKAAGQFLGEYAKAQGWDPNETQLVLVWTPDVPVHKARADGAKAGLEPIFPIPAANIHDVGTKALDDVLPNVTTWATAHPDAKNVLCFGHSDQPGVDCALALEKAGFKGRAAAASLGASDEALVDLRTRTDDESIFKATISYFPERYGEYLVPIIVDQLEGKTVPERVIPAVAPVTRANVNELYPATGAAATPTPDASAATATPAAAASAYTAEIRPATKKWKIGYGDGLAGIPFTETVTKNINKVAEQMGVDIVYCDNAYNQEKTVECSNNLVTQQVDGVIFANWIAGTEELIAGIFHDANIPCVAYDGPHPGCVAFGPDNFEAAKSAGNFLGEYAKTQGWDPKEVQLLLVWSPDVPVHKARADGATAGVKEIIDLPDANIHNIPHKELSDVLPNVSTWATAHPDAKYVLCFGHSDQPGVDCALALEKAGFQGRAVAVGTGASDEALVDLRTRTDDESIFKATISYFPERYGEYLVPIIVDLLEGKTVPERVIPAVAPVTRENIDELYPQ